MSVLNIKIRKIDKHNFYEVNNLEVAEEQKKFVSNPYYAIAQSKFERWIKTAAIYLDKTIIGFVAFGLNPIYNSYWIQELIIDKKYQNKGYGKFAINVLLKTLKQKYGCKKVFAGYKPDNFHSEDLCKSLGFTEIGFKEKHIVVCKDLI